MKDFITATERVGTDKPKLSFEQMCDEVMWMVLLVGMYMCCLIKLTD